MGLPGGDDVLDFRDGAILKTLYTCVRLATACRLRMRDFHQDGEEATLTINEKGNCHRTIGIHFAAPEALAEYLGTAGLAGGPIFRARGAPHSDELGDQPMSEASMYRVITGSWQSWLGRSRKVCGSTARIPCGRPPLPCSWMPASTFARFRNCSATGMYRPPRFTIKGGAPLRRAPRMTFQSERHRRGIRSFRILAASYLWIGHHMYYRTYLTAVLGC
jgi:hypothetical protein